ncbi:MAG: DNA methyltransferase [Pseudomonadota bacterium]
MGSPNHNTHRFELVSLDQLRFFEHSVRMHSGVQIAKIGTSLDRFGCVIPILIDEQNNVVCGEARVLAAVEIGWKTIPAMVASHLNSEEIRAYRLADNRLAEHAEWDRVELKKEFLELETLGIDLKFTGFEIPEIDLTLGVTSVAAEEDDINDLMEDRPVVSNLGDLFEVGPQRILCGDALLAESYARLLAGELAAMSFTDPPYNVRIKGHVSGSSRHSEFAQASGEMSVREFAGFLATFLRHVHQGLKPGAVLMACMDWRSNHRFVDQIEKACFDLINICVWTKSNPGMGSLYRSQYEFINVARVPGGKPINNVQLGKYGRNRSNVWAYPGASSIGSQAREDLSDHPTPKPVALVADAIMDVTRRGDLVLDPFGGGGTTLIAAHKAGRLARLIELSPGFVDLTIRRAEKVLGLTARCMRTGLTFDELTHKRSSAANVRQRERGTPRKQGDAL